MSVPRQRILAFFALATCVALGSGLVVPVLATGPAATTAPSPASGLASSTDARALPAPFAQADDGDGDDSNGDDEETHVINISTPGDPVEYTLTAPGLSPESDVDIDDDDGNESNQDVIRGDTATGFISDGNHDAYSFTGSIDTVRLESENGDALDVTIDGEPVDPRTLTGEGETETATTTATTAEPTTTTRTSIPRTTETTRTTETDGAHVIDVSAPGDDVEYTLTAPGLEPTDSVEVGENAAGAANPETVRGNTAFGTIGNGRDDTYEFTGSVDAVRLESNDIDKLDVTIDGEPVDPRTLTDEPETTAATATTGSTGTATTAVPTTTTAGPATTADAGGGSGQSESGQSGFGMVMFVLIGVVSGLVLAAALVYVVGSDRGG